MVRKFGRSTSGEVWDSSGQMSEPRYSWEQPQSWAEVVMASQQLMAIDVPEKGMEDDADGPSARPDSFGVGGAGGRM